MKKLSITLLIPVLLIALSSCTTMIVEPDQFEIVTGKLGELSETGFFEIHLAPSIREIGEVKIKCGEHVGLIPAGELDGVYVYYDDIANIIKISDSKNVLKDTFAYSVVLFK